MRILILICLLMLVLAGCRAIGLAPFGLAFDSKPVSEPNFVPEDSKAQLWTMVKKSNWTLTLAIPIIALGAVAAFNGMIKLGMSAIIFGCINLFMGLAVARFAIWMAIFGLVGSVIAVVVSILMKNRALFEVVRGVQLSKGEFGHQWSERKKAINNSQDEVQTKSTKKLVQDIKLKLKVFDPKIVITNGGK